ncbi:MAG: DUF2807 domain-containing protein [Chlorobi bacterium]|nr:DUF2807 domain-containing protein [Chlorobiota bacterium]
MRFLLIISVLSLISFTSISAQEETTTKRLTQIRKVSAFDKVKATKGINVTLVEGSREQVEVLIENGSPNDVITEVKDMQLTVKMKTKIYKDVAVQVYVTYVTLHELKAGSGATIDAENPVAADRLLLDGGTDSKIILEIDANAIEAEVSAGRMEISGTTKSQLVKANTGGKYLAFDLESENANVKANTTGRIEITVTKNLNATASNGGNIIYKGNPPKVTKRISMGGKIEPAE